MHRLLIVDDEVAIQRSIARLFTLDDDVEITTSSDGESAKVLLDQGSFDVVVSDERMPGISGTEFLLWVKDHHRDVQRIILTGYADQEATIRAINDAEVYRYLKKPWNSEDLVTTIKGAFELKDIQEQNRALESKIRSQNNDLKRLVAERTQQLQKSFEILKKQHEILKGQHTGLAELLVALVSQFEPDKGIQANYIARAWKGIEPLFDVKMREDSGDVAMLSVAILTHGTSFAGLMSSIEGFHEPARLIQLSLERWDGRGLLGMAGKDIPFESRLMRIVRDYYTLYPSAMDIARIVLSKGTGKIYDPDLTPIFLDNVRTHVAEEEVISIVPVKDLKDGLEIAQDLKLTNGSTLLHKGTILQGSSIQQLEKLGSYLDKGVSIKTTRVYTPPPAPRS